jgi:hypothetical protein
MSSIIIALAPLFFTAPFARVLRKGVPAPRENSSKTGLAKWREQD